ncbi:MAG: LysR family transcriptional regulator [Kangiellaceae bacterium]|nr:LysR family transcriptional regulator [Kangiellaceae bacterium]
MVADWNDINVAYHVAKYGTLTAAAEALDVHHSTVLRRINALEERLGTRLFHRHARGYVPTEAGELLTLVAENTQTGFDRMIGKIQGTDTELSGTLVITTVNSMAPNLMPILAEFQQKYPQIKLEYAAESRIFKLEHGEAHISIRPGTKPKDPDYVVQHLATSCTTFYASAEYVAKNGLIRDYSNKEEVAKHRFISTIDPFNIAKFMRWMNENINDEQIALRSSDFPSFIQAIKAGFGIAPVNCWLAATDKALCPMMQPPAEWNHDLWLVTHGDMHRTSKVQAFTQFLKGRFKQEMPVIQGANLFS